MHFLMGVFLCALTLTLHALPPTGRYRQIVDWMEKLQGLHPASSHVFSLGKNDEGMDIYSMRISSNPEKLDPAKIGHIVVSTHHGDESLTPLFTMRFVEGLLNRYAGPEYWRENLVDVEWTIIPVLNISGYNANQRHENGFDPNRDYPGPCTSQPGGKLRSIQTLMSLIKARIFSGSLTVHGYIGTLTYPWGVDVDNTHTLDHNIFEQATAKAARHNNYRYGTSTDVVYPCDGSYEDYVYWKHGMWSLLLELRNDFSTSHLEATIVAMNTYFGEIDASPSVKHELTSVCIRSGRVDLQIE